MAIDDAESMAVRDYFFGKNKKSIMSKFDEGYRLHCLCRDHIFDKNNKSKPCPKCGKKLEEFFDKCDVCGRIVIGDTMLATCEHCGWKQSKFSIADPYSEWNNKDPHNTTSNEMTLSQGRAIWGSTHQRIDRFLHKYKNRDNFDEAVCELTGEEPTICLIGENEADIIRQIERAKYKYLIACTCGKYHFDSTNPEDTCPYCGDKLKDMWHECEHCGQMLLGDWETHENLACTDIPKPEKKNDGLSAIDKLFAEDGPFAKIFAEEEEEDDFDDESYEDGGSDKWQKE